MVSMEVHGLFYSDLGLPGEFVIEDGLEVGTQISIIGKLLNELGQFSSCFNFDVLLVKDLTQDNDDLLESLVLLT
jgi:hypothetical protein